MENPRTSELRSQNRRVGALSLLRHPTALWRFLRDPNAPIWSRLVAVLTIVYVISPVDAVPDVLPVIGWLDDLGVTAFALAFVAAQAARYVNRTAPALDTPATNR